MYLYKTRVCIYTKVQVRMLSTVLRLCSLFYRFDQPTKYRKWELSKCLLYKINIFPIHVYCNILFEVRHTRFRRNVVKELVLCKCVKLVRLHE